MLLEYDILILSKWWWCTWSALMIDTQKVGLSTESEGMFERRSKFWRDKWTWWWAYWIYWTIDFYSCLAYGKWWFEGMGHPTFEPNPKLGSRLENGGKWDHGEQSPETYNVCWTLGWVLSSSWNWNGLPTIVFVYIFPVIHACTCASYVWIGASPASGVDLPDRSSSAAGLSSAFTASARGLVEANKVIPPTAQVGQA